ncbi:hypothetical protein [Archangium sp.]|nr:hypothetical protein [Archangium sp.]HYO56717.1 hypothetical protein [Archangium sp.]
MRRKLSAQGRVLASVPRWMPLEVLVSRLDAVRDAHLLVVTWRLAHALG